MIAVTGTPGTGKSVFARALAKRLGVPLVDLNALIAEKKIYKLDSERTKIADLSEMRREFVRAIKDTESVVVEGLLAYLLPKKLLTHVVVLRTEPKILKRRLRARKFSEAKTRENVEAEALDIILWEVVDVHGTSNVYEINTTRLKPDDAVERFLDAVAGKISLKPGGISWLEEYLKLVRKSF